MKGLGDVAGVSISLTVVSTELVGGFKVSAQELSSSDRTRLISWVVLCEVTPWSSLMLPVQGLVMW